MKKFIEYTTPVQEKYDGMVGDPVILQPGGVNLYYVGQQISSFIAVPGTVGSKGGGGESVLDRYFANNQSGSSTTTGNIVRMAQSTPGQEDEENGFKGVNTDSLNMGPAGSADEESRKNIQRAAIARLKDAKERWQFLKTWIKDFDVDKNTQAKIAGLDAVAGINAPSIAKMAKTYILPSGKREEL
jgi:hypothetical protein